MSYGFSIPLKKDPILRQNANCRRLTTQDEGAIGDGLPYQKREEGPPEAEEEGPAGLGRRRRCSGLLRGSHLHDVQVHAGEKIFPESLSTAVRKPCISVRNIQETSLHGLKYITESLRHSVERIFWLVTIVVAWAFAGYLIYKVCDKHFFKQFFESLAKGISNTLIGGSQVEDQPCPGVL